MIIVNVDRSEGSTFVILAASLATIKEWHGIKVEGVRGKNAQPGIKGWSHREESGLSYFKG